MQPKKPTRLPTPTPDVREVLLDCSFSYIEFLGNLHDRLNVSREEICGFSWVPFVFYLFRNRSSPSTLAPGALMDSSKNERAAPSLLF